MEQRRPLYAEVATATVVTDGRTPEEIAADVLAVLKH
jgi:shikimate kinase